MIPQF